MINVRDFGAIGDGVTDDTVAFQAAADQQRKTIRAYRPTNGSDMGGCETVVIPTGNYLISGGVDWCPYASILGEKSVVVSTPDVLSGFFFDDCYNNEVTGIRFSGVSLLFRNRNIDSTFITVRGCDFQWTRTSAISVSPPRDVSHMSAQVSIERCRFLWCNAVLRTAADYNNVSGCWVQCGDRNPGYYQFGVESRMANLNLTDFVGVPVFRDNESMWIHSMGSVFAERCRFGGEGIGGIPIVHHAGFPDLSYPFMGQTVSITNSMTCAGPGKNPKSSVVTLEGVPQQLILSGNNRLNDTRQVLVLDSATTFLDAYPKVKSRVKWNISNNMTWPTTLDEQANEVMRGLVS